MLAHRQGAQTARVDKEARRSCHLGSRRESGELATFWSGGERTTMEEERIKKKDRHRFCREEREARDKEDKIK
jgi:hypothetical protein